MKISVVKLTPYAAMLLLFNACFAADESSSLKTGGEEGGKINLGYINEHIPKFKMPAYSGTHYLDTVPDTVDVAEMSKLAINVLTNATNPNADYEMYFWGEFAYNPIYMRQDFSDWCQGKFTVSLPLQRILTGSKDQINVDKVWMESILKSIGPDGLFYYPLDGRPWFKNDMINQGFKTAYIEDGKTIPVEDPKFNQCSASYPIGAALCTMTAYYQIDGNPVWKSIIEKMITRTSELVVDKGDYAYFPFILIGPNVQYDKSTMGPPQGPLGNAVNGWLLAGLSRYYNATGYKPALELGRKLANYGRYHMNYFDQDGKFLEDPSVFTAYGLPPTQYGGHFHAHTCSMVALAEYAAAADDRDLMQWVVKTYEWAKSPEACGSSLIGWFPEIISKDYPACESCIIGDMINVALKISNAGAADYYNDVERWMRNHFSESQLDRIDWLAITSRNYPEMTKVPPHATVNRVAERNRGAFAGWSGANDWWVAKQGIMHCCTGNCSRPLYNIWESISTFKDATLQVNMLLNKASKEVDIHSHIPYKGQVDLLIKRDCKSVMLHAPSWTLPGDDQIVLTVNGELRKINWEGSYLDLGAAKAGETMVVKFPISEQTVKERIGGIDYTLILKGDTVVSIDPPGKNCPLYQRDHYRADDTRWIKLSRFVADKPISW